MRVRFTPPSQILHVDVNICVVKTGLVLFLTYHVRLEFETYTDNVFVAFGTVLMFVSYRKYDVFLVVPCVAAIQCKLHSKKLNCYDLLVNC